MVAITRWLAISCGTFLPRQRSCYQQVIELFSDGDTE